MLGTMRMNKITFFLKNSLFTFHFEYDLEILKKCVKKALKFMERIVFAQM